MKHRPVIGILATEHQYNILLPVFSVGTHYSVAVAEAGAVPVLVPVSAGMPEETLSELVDRFDGFLHPGGGDFNPCWYGEEPLPELPFGGEAPALDVQETVLRFLRLAAASGKPILGICLGIQTLNIAFGGSLYQDIPMQVGRTVRHSMPMEHLPDRWQTAHTVRIAEGSLLRTVTGSEELQVNSFHHQAVKSVAPGFHATAWAPDGLIEAMESEDGRILGVQWHPENLSYATDPAARALFRWLADAARREAEE